MNDMSSVIIPKSDQINADSLLAGPMTVTIKDVLISGGQEQPVSIVLEETALFFRPCKSMSRVLVGAWGPDAKAYIGRSLTLYRDPTVKWGGLEVGGIRISHMSDIDGVKQMMLTATKGSRKPFKVLPLVKQAGSTQPSDFSGQLAELKALAQPGNMDALGAKWQEIGADARKALAAELPALKAACNAPAAEDVPFDAPVDKTDDNSVPVAEVAAQPTGLSLADQIADRPGETVDPDTGEITDVHPGKAIADAIIVEIEAPECNAEMDVKGILAKHEDNIAALLDEDACRVEIAASKRRDAIAAAKAKAQPAGAE